MRPVQNVFQKLSRTEQLERGGSCLPVVGGARPPPLIKFTLTSKVAVYAPAEWADTLTLFHLYQDMYSVYMTFTTVHILCTGVVSLGGKGPIHQSANSWTKSR